MLGAGRLDQRPVELVLHVERQQFRQDRLSRWTEDVIDRRSFLLTVRPPPLWWGDRQHPQRRRRRRYRAVELREDDIHRVEITGGEAIHQRLGELGRMRERPPGADCDALRRDGALGGPEVADAFLPDEMQLGVDVLRLEL